MGRHRCLELCELTREWSIEERTSFSHFLQRQDLKKSEVLFYENNENQSLFFLAKGMVRAENTLGHIDLNEGASWGEFSLSKAVRKRVTIRAMDDCELWVLQPAAWERLKTQTPLLAFKLMEGINAKMASRLSWQDFSPLQKQLQAESA
jgi:CRP-like cAMP-binding protein